MSIFGKLKNIVIGAPLNPFSPIILQHVSLIALLAWVGLGADGLSSACYGPEEAYIALGTHTHLAIYIALAMAITVFIISIGYNQVIELFPSGGGGYKVATQLLGSYVGLFSGAALLVDYVLTITVSAASGMDALFSIFPAELLTYKFFRRSVIDIFTAHLEFAWHERINQIFITRVFRLFHCSCRFNCLWHRRPWQRPAAHVAKHGN